MNNTMARHVKYYINPDPFGVMDFIDNIRIDVLNTFTRYDIYGELLYDIFHPIIGIFNILYGIICLPFHALFAILLLCCCACGDKIFIDCCNNLIDDLMYIISGLVKLIITPFIPFKIITRLILMCFQEKSFVEDIVMQEVENKKLVDINSLILTLQKMKNDENILYLKEDKQKSEVQFCRKSSSYQIKEKLSEYSEYAVIKLGNSENYDIGKNMGKILNLYKKIASIGYDSNFHDDFISDGEKIIEYLDKPLFYRSDAWLSKNMIDFAEAWISNFLKLAPKIELHHAPDSKKEPEKTSFELFKKTNKEAVLFILEGKNNGFMRKAVSI